VLVDELERERVALAVCGDGRLEHDHAAEHVHNRERMRVRCGSTPIT
jgi:hypothetical protein